MGLSSSSLKKIMIGFEIRINNREPVIITSYDVAFVMVNCNYSFDDNIYIGGTDTLSMSPKMPGRTTFACIVRAVPSAASVRRIRFIVNGFYRVRR